MGSAPPPFLNETRAPFIVGSIGRKSYNILINYYQVFAKFRRQRNRSTVESTKLNIGYPVDDPNRGEKSNILSQLTPMLFNNTNMLGLCKKVIQNQLEEFVITRRLIERHFEMKTSMSQEQFKKILKIFEFKLNEKEELIMMLIFMCQKLHESGAVIQADQTGDKEA